MVADLSKKNNELVIPKISSIDILAEINSQLGKEVVQLGNNKRFEITRMPTGSLTIDRISGGGFAAGRHVELYGTASGGKSLIAYKTAAICQRRGGIAALIDAESSYTPEWFSHIGGKPEELIVSQPEIAEDAIEAMIIMMQQGVNVIIVDSASALLTKEERSKAPTEEARIASQARFMSINLRRLTTMNDKTLVIWINQQRTNIGVSFGDPNVTTSGRSLAFYDTTRIEVVRGEQIKKAGSQVKKFKAVNTQVTKGYWTLVKSRKDKSTKPYMEGSFIFDYDQLKIDEISEIMQLGLEDEILTRSGNTFTYIKDDGTELSGTEIKIRNALKSDENLRKELIDKIEKQTEVLSKPKQSVIEEESIEE